MKFNKSRYSKRMQERLSRLGVYIQHDDSIAISEHLPKHHLEDPYIIRFDSFKECIKYLRKNIEDIQDNFVSLWKSFEGDCENSIVLEKVYSKVDDKLVASSLNALMGVAMDYEACSESVQRLLLLKKNFGYIKESFKKKLTYYATIIDHSEAEMIEEYMRVEDIETIVKLHKEAKVKRLIKEAYGYGYNDGAGPSGRTNPLGNNPMTPFSNFDFYDGRVGDGRNIGEGQGHATEKFEITNRFKRKPELSQKKNFKYRSKALMYVSKKMKKRLRQKEKNKGDKFTLKSNGLIYVDSTDEPARYTWWDEQRNNPYSFDDREIHGTYPTWKQYR